MNPDVLLEALLFYKATALRKRDVAAALGVTEEALPTHIETLRTRLQTGALTLVETSTEIQLVTNAAVSSFLEAVRKDELRTEIGKAGAETLAIVVYKEPVTRAEIDRIRGVNSSVTIRNLLMRGLIARSPGTGARGHTYTITPELLALFGIEQKQQLPDYAAILDRIEAFESVEAT